MKEFELRGDISSGFRWRVEGATEVKREAFVPLGEGSPLEGSSVAEFAGSSGSEGCTRIQAEDRAMKTECEDPGYDRPYIPLERPPSGTAIVFEFGYELLLASEREARRQLLAPLAMLPLAYVEKFGVTKFVDPYVARELHLQEKRDKELRDLFDVLFGRNVGRYKAGDWRIGLCIEARRNDHACDELERTMVAAMVRDETGEAGRFIEARKAVDRFKKRGPIKVAKAWALLFVLVWRGYGAPLPTKGKVLRFVRSQVPAEDIADSLKRNASRDIFTGPILSVLMQGRAGRPRKTRQGKGSKGRHPAKPHQ